MIFDKFRKVEKKDEFCIKDYLEKKFVEMDKKNKSIEKDLLSTNRLLNKAIKDISNTLKENIKEIKASKIEMTKQNRDTLNDLMDELRKKFEYFCNKKLNAFNFDIDKRISLISEKIDESFPENQKLYSADVNRLNAKIQSFVNYEDNLKEFTEWAKGFFKSESKSFFIELIAQVKRFDANSGNLLTHYHVKIDEISKILKAKL